MAKDKARKFNAGDIVLVENYGGKLSKAKVVSQNREDVWIKENKGRSYITLAENLYSSEEIIYYTTIAGHAVIVTADFTQAGCQELSQKQERELFKALAERLGYELS